MTSQSIADDVIMTRQLRRDHAIPNSLVIDFIHGDIHGGSCKKLSSYDKVGLIQMYGKINIFKTIADNSTMDLQPDT